MDITRVSLNNFFRSLSIKYNESLLGGQPAWQGLGLVERYDATGEDIIELGWLAHVPGLTKFLGEAQIKNIAASKFSFQTEPYESTIAVSRRNLEHDKLGMYSNLAASHAHACNLSVDNLVAQALFAGFSTLKTYTGNVLFSTTHRALPSAPTFSNLITNKFSAGSFELARKMIRGRTSVGVGPDGKGLNLKLGRKLVITVGPKNETAAKNLVTAEKQAGGADNPYKGAARVEVMNEIGAYNEDAWFLHEEGVMGKPLVLAESRPMTPAWLNDPSDSHVIKFQEFLWQIVYDAIVVPGLPELIIGSDGSAAAL